MTHVLVLGAYGSAGVAAAEQLADAPEIDRLTLVDDGEPGGGLCILRGCMPSKDLLSAAAHRYQARHDERLDEPPSVDVQRAVDVKEDHVLDFASHRRDAVHRLAARDGVEFVHGTGRFADERVVRVDDRQFEPDYVVVATGSTVNVPDLDGLDEVDYLTSRDVLDATEFPDSGVVMGFGYVGVELVPYLVEVGGMDLTVIEHDDRPFDRADPEFGDELLSIYREEFGVEILTNTCERSVESTSGGVRLHVDRAGTERTIEADDLFLFTGRRPNLAGLELERTALDPGTGWVEDTMRARDDPHVFVAGDATGDEMILHEAKEKGIVAASNVVADVVGDPLDVYDPIVHRVLFAAAGVYPYASVGMTAEEARDAGHEPIVVRREASHDGVFRVKAVPRGLAKLVVDDDGTILGYHGLHHDADVMAKTVQVIVEREMGVRDVPDRAYHPTTPEILDGLLRQATTELADEPPSPSTGE